MRFTDIFIRRPVLASVVSLMIFLLGLRSLGLLNVREYPQSSKAVITISTAYPGASGSLVKGFITTPLERSISQANGIDYLTSTSMQGLSQIQAHLELNYDPNKALTQITEKVNAVLNQLPRRAQQPTLNVTVGQSTDSMYLSFFSDELNSKQITDYLRRVVQPKLETVSGVQTAEILGAHTYAARIWLNPQRMAALNVTPQEVSQALRSNNYLAAVGKSKGEMVAINLTASTHLTSADAFKSLVIKHKGDTQVHLGDIGKVELGAADYSTSARFNGKDATYIGIKVVPTANPLTVIDKIRKRFPKIKANFPPGLQAKIPYDATQYIQDSIHEVVRTILESLAIVILVIYLFLGSVRSVVVPVVAIPLSLIGASLFMLALGFSINLLTLLAMVLAIGLVVDDAIIVVENIHRHIEEGQKPVQAALRGARELSSAVIAMSLTLVAVYSPIGFMGGLTGSLFKEFAFSLAGAVVISGIVALTLSPMLCSKLLTADAGRYARFVDRTSDRLAARYRSVLHSALDTLPVILFFGAAILVSCYFLFNTSKQELAPKEDQGIIIAKATGAPTATIDQTSFLSKQITQIYQSFPETDNVFLINGVGGGGGASTPNHAIAGMVLKPWSERKPTAMELKPKVQAKLKQIAGFNTVAFLPPTLPGAGGGLPVQFVIGSIGSPLSVYKVAEKLKAKAMKSGLFVYMDSDLKYDKPQDSILIDRKKAADLGLNMSEVGADLASMMGGNYVNRFSIQGRSYKVIPQVERSSRLTPDQLKQYHVRTSSGKMVPLSTIVSLKRSVEPEQIKRFQQLNSATLSAVLAPGVSMGQALKYLKTQAKAMMPQGFSINYGGQSRQFVKESNALMVTFFFAIIIIYLVLAAQFESFRDPLIILVSVPMSIAGALTFVSLGMATINIYTEVGLITLIGLISKHGILIVQFANQLQQEGYAKREALERAAGIRLRPILMTASAMIISVVPLLLATGPGAVSRFDIGLVISTGLAIGTFFTLFVVPAMYLWIGKDLGAQKTLDQESVEQSHTSR